MERKNFNEAVLDSLCLMCNQTFVPREDALDVLRKRGVPNPERTFALLEAAGNDPSHKDHVTFATQLGEIYQEALRTRP